MVEVLIGAAAVLAAAVIAIDLLGNREIIDSDSELGAGTGGPIPYDDIGNLSCDTPVEFTCEDQARARGAARQVKDLLGKNPVRGLQKADPEQRIALAYELHRCLCEEFSLEGVKLELGDGKKDGTCGYYTAATNTMWLNCCYLLSDNPDFISEYLDTVFHEFRHAMQYRFIEDASYNGCSNEDYQRRMAISLHPKVYISHREAPELYRKQLCERDAVKFARMAMKMMKGGK